MIAEIQRLLVELANAIRRHCVNQKGSWQKIPNLVASIPNYLNCGRYSMAVSLRLWPVKSMDYPWSICVNLDNGELVCLTETSKSIAATDVQTIELMDKLDLIDAQKIIAQINRKIGLV